MFVTAPLVKVKGKTIGNLQVERPHARSLPFFHSYSQQHADFLLRRSRSFSFFAVAFSPFDGEIVLLEESARLIRGPRTI